jgi:hypothetical protein
MQPGISRKLADRDRRVIDQLPRHLQIREHLAYMRPRGPGAAGVIGKPPGQADGRNAIAQAVSLAADRGQRGEPGRRGDRKLSAACGQSLVSSGHDRGPPAVIWLMREQSGDLTQGHGLHALCPQVSSWNGFAP